MSTPPSDPVTGELQALRASLDGLSTRLGELTAENRDLRERLELSEQARRDLKAQSEQLLHMLDVSRREVHELRRSGGASS